MRKILKLTVLVSVALISLLPFALAADIPETITVSGSCSIDVDTSAIGFGAVAPGSTSSPDVTKTVSLSTNDAPSDVDISGTIWTGSSHTMSVGATEYELDTVVGFSSLDTTPALLFSSSTSTSHDVALHVVVPANQGADVYSQTLTFQVSCNQQV